MKPQLMAGILLAVLGAFIVFRGLSYGSQHSVIQVGDVKASVDARSTIPTWVGWGGDRRWSAADRRRRSEKAPWRLRATD